MKKNIRYFLLTSLALGFLQLETLAMLSEKEEDESNNNPSILMKDPNHLSLLIKRRYGTELNFAACSVDDDFACNIAEGLKNSHITKITFNVNSIGNKGIKALAHSFKTLKLASLDLSANPIDDEGFSDLFSALKEIKSLRVLDIRSTKIGSTGVRMLIELLESNPELTYVGDFKLSKAMLGFETMPFDKNTIETTK